MNIKEKIIEIGNEMGFNRVVIAALEPMVDEQDKFERWLELGYAASMDYLKRDPQKRGTPQALCEASRSAIVVSINYFTPPPQDPGPLYGRVASYAVGIDYHVVIRAKLRQYKERIEKEIGKPLIAKQFTDDVALIERGLATRHGLGFAGRNTLVIGPKLSGSYNFIAELFTDLEVEPDQEYVGTCGKCFRCGDSCPTKAIDPVDGVNANLCISYLTIENKGEIPLDLRPKLGRWLFGCDICQIVCPYNQLEITTPWREFEPAQGTGHYLRVTDLLEIKDQESFHKQFVRTAVRRPKRLGLLRNALVVIGNSLADPNTSLESVQQLTASLLRFSEIEENQMLLEHALWALTRNSYSRCHSFRIMNRLHDAAMRSKVLTYF